MAKAPAKELINLLTNKWSGNFKANASIVVQRVIELVEQGSTAQAAVNQAFIESEFAAKNKAALDSTLFEAAAYGYGIMPNLVIGKKAIIEKLTSLPWAPDNMPLSTRLHGLNNVMKATIGDVIKANMTEGTKAVKLARELYDGYNSSKVLNTAELPSYLQQLDKYAKKAISEGVSPDIDTVRDYRQTLKRATRLVDGMSAGTNKPLKAAYKQLLDATQGFSSESLKKAVYVAAQERSRYFAERIARTEIARAWGDGFLAETIEDPDVVAYKWGLSSSHPAFDICNFHANADLYGLGPGIYPKDRLPSYPAHPHCRCLLEEVFKGEIDLNKGKDNNVEKLGRRYLEALDESQQTDLLGQKGAQDFNKGEEWQQHLKNWQGHSNPVTRLVQSDFNIDYSKAFTAENLIIPKDKLVAYALNKEHKLGGPKAVAFEKALGYTKDNYKDLSDKVKNSIGDFDIVNKGATKHGVKFEVLMTMTGPNGKSANVITGWIIKNNEQQPRMTTIYVTGKEVGKK